MSAITPVSREVSGEVYTPADLSTMPKEGLLDFIVEVGRAMAAGTYAIGDAVLALGGYGITAQQVSKLTGVDYKLIRIACILCRKFPPGKRYVDLPLTHARAIARCCKVELMDGVIAWCVENPTATTHEVTARCHGRLIEKNLGDKAMQKIVASRRSTEAGEVEKPSHIPDRAGETIKVENLIYFSAPLQVAMPLGTLGPTYALRGRASDPEITDLFVDGVWVDGGNKGEMERAVAVHLRAVIAKSPGLAEMKGSDIYDRYLKAGMSAAQIAIDEGISKCARKLGTIVGRLEAMGVTEEEVVAAFSMDGLDDDRDLWSKNRREQAARGAMEDE